MAKLTTIISVIVVVFVFEGLIPCEGYRAHTAWQNPNVVPKSNDEGGSEESPFTVISGWITDPDNSDESSEQRQPHNPWGHHVDFDELHPGEDQVAEETVDRENRFNPFRFPFQVPPLAPRESVEVTQPQQGDDRIVVPLPRFTPSTEPENRSPFGSLLDLNLNLTLNKFMRDIEKIWQLHRKPTPWYKGSNVCIKREEEDEIVEADPETTSSDSDTVTMIIDDDDDIVSYNDLAQQEPKDQPFSSVEEALNNTEASPEWHMRLSYCKDLDTRRECYMKLFGPTIKRTVTVKYECCHGYELDAAKENCERTRYETVGKTIEDVGGTEFIALVKNAGLMNKLRNEDITVFVPSNDAVATYLTSHAIDSNAIEFVLEPQLARRRRSLLFHRNNNPQGRNIRRHNLDHHNRPGHNGVHSEHYHEEESFEESSEDFDLNDIDWKQNALNQHESQKRNVAYNHEDNQSKLQKALLSHMMQGKITTDDFVDEKVVFSEDKDSVLRMNTWNVGNEQVKTINCARLTSINHKSSNGVVHLIDRMVKPVTKSIAEVIGSDPELSLLHTLIASSGMMDMLSDRNQNLTMFAPTNAAINKLGHAILHKMQHGDPCLKRILRHHLLPLTFCSSIIYNQGQIRNIDHDLLDISKEADDKLYINGSQILVRDIMTTNGVVHVIDAVLLSENDLPVSKALEKDGYTRFLSYLRRAGLEDYLDELENVTLFVPSNQAMEEIDQEILNSPSKLREILLYHIVTPEMKTCSFSHDMMLPSRLTDKSVRINLFSHFPIAMDTQATAQCGKIVKGNRMACNGVIHEVDRVLIPSDLNVIETLKTQTDFAIFTRFLIESGLADKMKQSNASLTVFAPTDSAFMDLPKDVFRNLLENKENATKMVKSHITEEPLCCAGVVPNNWFVTRRVDCINGVMVPVFRNTNGEVLFGNAKVTTCDLTASNGIIHAIDKVVLTTDDREEFLETSCLPGIMDDMRSSTFFIRL